LHTGESANTKASFLSQVHYHRQLELKKSWRKYVKYNKIWSIQTIRWRELLKHEGECARNLTILFLICLDLGRSSMFRTSGLVRYQ
jgi:hypothetical protein